MSAVAAARTASGWPSSMRLVGPIAERAGDGGVESAADGDVEIEILRAHGDVGEAGVAQDAPHARFVGEGERAGVLGVRLGQGRGVLPGFAQRDHHPRILLGLAPAGEDEPSAGLEAAAQIGEGSRRIGEEHDAESRHDEIGPSGSKS